MNKKLLAIAVGAAMVAGTTVAMAEATLYGKINMGLVSYDNGDDTATGNPASGIGVYNEATRVGVKGSADLGNGMKAIFKMESTTDIDDGAGGFILDRDTYFGLKGGFGEVTMGRRNTAFKNATGKMDVFADMLGDMTGNGFGNFDQREANMVKYKNKFGMVTLEADLHFAEAEDVVATAGVDESAMGNSIAVSFAPMKGLKASIASATCGGTCSSGTEGDNATKVGVQWKGGPHTVNFVYKQQDRGTGATTGNTTMYAQYALKMDMNAIQVAYQTADREEAAGQDADSTQISLAFVNNMSKATKVYVAYTAVTNGTNARNVGRIGSISLPISSSTGANPITADSDPTAFGVGVTHNF